jgi:hypothetical protein
MALRFDSDLAGPDGSPVPDASDLDGAITIGELTHPMDSVWPAVDATNGPLTADAGAVGTAPSFSGLTYYSWDSGKFNSQSQNWLPVPASLGPGTNTEACYNKATPRAEYFATPGITQPAHIDFGFIADTAKIILVYRHFGNYTPGSYHETHIFAEHDGRLKQIRSAPEAFSGSGNKVFYRTVTFKEARRREFRFWLTSNLWLMGVYIDNTASIEKSPNRPLVAFPGDSWRDGAGNVFNLGGNGGAAGVTWPSSCSLLLSCDPMNFLLHTGFAGILCGQGGTGYFNANNGSTSVGPDETAAGSTPFLSSGQVNHLWDTWGSRKPIVFVAGGWNDGSLGGTPYLNTYQTRAGYAYDKLIAKNSKVPIIVAGIQPKSIVTGDARDLSNQGLQAAVAARPNNCIGFIDQLTRWNSTQIAPKVGPDGLHPTVYGGHDIGYFYAQKAAKFKVSRAWINDQLTAA